MACSSDPKKVALWRSRFRRFLGSGLTVARFCLVEGVSESSFYYWQKKLRPQARLGLRAHPRASRTEARSTGEDDGRSDAWNHGARTEGRSTGEDDGRFGVGNHDARSEDRNVGSDDGRSDAWNHGARSEDRNVGSDDGRSDAWNHGARSEDRNVGSDDGDVGSEDRHIFTPVSVVPAAYGVVVRLPGGARIEVGAQHLDAIRAVVAETVRADHGQLAERNASTNNPAIRKASPNNPVVCEASTNNPAIRKASPNNPVVCEASIDNHAISEESTDNQSTRKASSGNQSTRKASSGNQNIRRRSGTTRTRHGAVSC